MTRTANTLKTLLCGGVLMMGWQSAFGEAGEDDKATTGARVGFAVAYLRAALDDAGVAATISTNEAAGADIVLTGGDGAPEHFTLTRAAGGPLRIRGGDDSGILYGCLELAQRVRAAKRLPETIGLADGPELKMRGPCIGMQRLMASKGGNYLWPYTPENFPFFYDKDQWIEYLDFLFENRMNSLYLWNGHPFASLVTLADYPEAAEVSPEVMKLNRETMHWLTSECDKRGIWLIQMFYNIHLPEGLAKKHKLSTSLGKSHPIAADYTRKALAKFVEDYPSVGLLVCLGEALSGKENQVEWFTQTIIPGVQDGLRARGWSGADLANKDKLPPIVVRGHHIVEYGSHKDVLGEGMKLYPNLMSMVKFNGESLTTWEPRGKYQQYHKDMAAYSGTHLANVHLLSNLEPFRYADFSFVRNSARAIRDRLDGNGVHLYPLAYWDWPNAPDKAVGLRQLDRDRLWFEIWARYAWKLDRDPDGEKEHWVGRLKETYGTRGAAEKIYEAYDASGECAPRLLRRFGITGGNRQALALGMLLDQMVNASKYRVWVDLRDSDSPPGEDLREYVTRAWKKETHVGETPPQIVREAREFAREAVMAIEAAAAEVTTNREEFERLRNDMHCIQELTEHITQTAEAAMLAIRHEFSKDPNDLKAALPHLEASVAAYRRLSERAGPAYRYAGGLHGRQRVPFHGVWHWSQMIERYEAELEAFRARVVGGGGGGKSVSETAPAREPLVAVPFKLLTPGMETYKIEKGAKVFTDRDDAIREPARELQGLTGIRFAHSDAKKGKEMVVEIDAAEPCRVLVGYFKDEKSIWLQVPDLEHVAHANERGGYDVSIPDAAAIEGLPGVNVHAFRYEAGRQRIEMIGTGSFVILGVVSAGAATEPRATVANAADGAGKSGRLRVLREHQGPVIGPDHPDVTASGNRSGFETGLVLKLKGVYHMFVNEMFGRPHLDLRISHWSSADAMQWKREGTLVESVPGRSPKNPRSEVWVTGMAYNETEDRWNMFYVAYRGGDAALGEREFSDYEGTIWRAGSRTKGRDGIGGPYEDAGIVLRPDKDSQPWEGQQGTDSFFPYQVGDRWYGIYGSHNHIPRGPWPVGLATAPSLAGPWKRMPEGNPLPMVKEFAENPVAIPLADGRRLAVFDSLGPREIGYSISEDGVAWPPETRLIVQSGANEWAGKGDHDLRTPLGIVPEEDGTFTILYTARMSDRPFWAVGKCTVEWEKE